MLVALLVVAAQVARVGSRLVDVGLRGVELPFQFEDDHCPFDEQNDIGPTRFVRQFVFHDRGVLLRGG